MLNVLGKLAEKIGVVVQSGGILNIENFYHQNDQQRTRSRNEYILLKQVKNETYSRLRQSLHAQLITLDKELQPQLVIRCWDTDIKLGLKDSEPLPQQTTILDIFQREDIGGRLLILGSPGAGKTTTQLQLAKALVEDYVGADPDYPIPVLFNLASWRKGSIHAWLVEKLKLKYGVRADISTHWLQERKLLLLLDGLDELKAELQESCVEALNHYLSGEEAPEYIVVCCRSEEYRQLKTRLQLNGAVYLKPLTDQQIQDYLSEINQENLWTVASQNAQFLALIRTPLMLGVTVLAHQDLSSQDWENDQAIHDRTQVLWDVYIQRLMNPGSGSRLYATQQTPSQRQTRYWLMSLARHLSKIAQDEFLLDQMQPAVWLTDHQLRLYTGINLLVGCIGSGLMAGFFILIGGHEAFITNDLSFTARDWFILIAITWGTIGAIITGFRPVIRPVESIRWSWRQAGQKLRTRTSYWLLFWFVIWFLNGVLISWRVFQHDFPEEYPLWIVFLGAYWFSILWGLILGLFYGIFSALILEGLIGGLTGPEINDKYYPNQGIKRSAINAVYFWGIGAAVSALVGGLWAAFAAPQISPWRYALSLVPIWGLTASLLGGGKACLQHLTLRVLLYRQGQIPWNYARFLDYCTERLLVQRVGGRYRFIHKQLQEHFAAMPFSKAVDIGQQS